MIASVVKFGPFLINIGPWVGLLGAIMGLGAAVGFILLYNLNKKNEQSKRIVE